MRARVSAALLGLVLAAPAASAPIAPWADGAGLDPERALSLSHLKRSRCLPQPGDVAVPIYPGAVVVDLAWGRMVPGCRARAGWSQLGAIVLASRDAPHVVAGWYAERLTDHAQGDTDRGRIFLRGEVPTFEFERDYYKHPNVYVREADAPWRAAGYATFIELNRPAP
jgi:hypothetical protein